MALLVSSSLSSSSLSIAINRTNKFQIQNSIAIGRRRRRRRRRTDDRNSNQKRAIMMMKLQRMMSGTTTSTDEKNETNSSDKKEIKITFVDCSVKSVEIMRRECKLNAKESIMELENCRFDVFRSENEFVLCEIYKGEEAVAEHKREKHYRQWQKNVDAIMEKPRTKRTYEPIFPSNDDWNSVNTPLQIDENGQVKEPEKSLALACHVTIKVVKGEEKKFEKLSVEDAIASKLEENGGCLRFDILKSKDNECEYLFLEVFKDREAFDFHSKTRHSINWKEKVKPIMAEDRTWVVFDEIVFPEDDEMWKDGESCEDACDMAW